MNLSKSANRIYENFKNGVFSTSQDLATFINYFNEYMIALVNLSRELNLEININRYHLFP